MKSMSNKSVNGPIKSDITLQKKKNNCSQSTNEESNNLSTTSIEDNCETSENNVIRTIETPNNNDVINNDLAAPTRKKEFPTNTTPFKLASTETEWKWKNTYPIFYELKAPVSNKTVWGFSSKPSGVDFDVVIDKSSK